MIVTMHRTVGTPLFLRFKDIDGLGFDKKRRIFGFDQVQTCLIFPLRWAGFPIKIGRNAQWEHLFLMYFDDFRPFTFFQSQSPFLMIK